MKDQQKDPHKKRREFIVRRKDGRRPKMQPSIEIPIQSNNQSIHNQIKRSINLFSNQWWFIGQIPINGSLPGKIHPSIGISRIFKMQKYEKRKKNTTIYPLWAKIVNVIVAPHTEFWPNLKKKNMMYLIFLLTSKFPSEFSAHDTHNFFFLFVIFWKTIEYDLYAL